MHSHAQHAHRRPQKRVGELLLDVLEHTTRLHFTQAAYLSFTRCRVHDDERSSWKTADFGNVIDTMKRHFVVEHDEKLKELAFWQSNEFWKAVAPSRYLINFESRPSGATPRVGHDDRKRLILQTDVSQRDEFTGLIRVGGIDRH